MVSQQRGGTRSSYLFGLVACFSFCILVVALRRQLARVWMRVAPAALTGQQAQQQVLEMGKVHKNLDVLSLDGEEEDEEGEEEVPAQKHQQPLHFKLDHEQTMQTQPQPAAFDEQGSLRLKVIVDADGPGASTSEMATTPFGRSSTAWAMASPVSPFQVAMCASPSMRTASAISPSPLSPRVREGSPTGASNQPEPGSCTPLPGAPAESSEEAGPASPSVMRYPDMSKLHFAHITTIAAATSTGTAATTECAPTAASPRKQAAAATTAAPRRGSSKRMAAITRELREDVVPAAAEHE